MTNPEREARNQRIRKDAQSGLTSKELQVKYNLSAPTTYRIAGDPLRINREARTQSIIKDAHAGLTTTELSRKYDLTPQHIRRLAGPIIKAQRRAV